MNTRVSSPARTEMLDKLWDYGHVEWALLDYVHREAALLVGPVDELLIALARPPHPRQFLVAAIAPPGTDGVWTPEQTGCFLDYVEQDRLYMLWQIIAFRGTRRGEVCGVRWEDRSRSTRTLAIATQLVQDNWDVYEGAPKTDSGIRLIARDEETDQGLDTHRIRQQQEREACGHGAGLAAAQSRRLHRDRWSRDDRTTALQPRNTGNTAGRRLRGTTRPDLARARGSTTGVRLPTVSGG
nr:hypothetical protein [Actinacidiphila oryziradicis]